jgi:hypothetical protein
MYRRLLTFLYNISLYPNAWAWGGCLTILIPFFLFYFCLDFLLSFLETDGVWNTGLLIDFDNGVELETSHCISSARLSILSLSLRSVSISAIWTVCFNCLAIGHSTGGTRTGQQQLYKTRLNCDFWGILKWRDMVYYETRFCVNVSSPRYLPIKRITLNSTRVSHFWAGRVRLFQHPAPHTRWYCASKSRDMTVRRGSDPLFRIYHFTVPLWRQKSI